MNKEWKNMQSSLFVVTILFFLIGMIHISFATVGLLCFGVPLYLYLKYKEKVWCKHICPRAGFFTKVLSKINIGLKPPQFLAGAEFRKAVVIYFAINLFFVTMSTIMVSIGRLEPIEMVRFMIVYSIPLKLPQLLDLNVSDNLVHLGYRAYSMMFTSTFIGVILGVLYKPRTWCRICPVNTLTKVVKS
jgi:hypothetical protein